MLKILLLDNNKTTIIYNKTAKQNYTLIDKKIFFFNKVVETSNKALLDYKSKVCKSAVLTIDGLADDK